MSGLSRMISLRGAARHFSTSRVALGNPYGWDGTVPEEHKNKKEMLCAGMGHWDYYCGHPSYPAESVRFLPDSPYVQDVLRPKEKLDWHNLTVDEKKTLYRTSYQQTVVEQVMYEPGVWRGDLAFVILYFAAACGWFMYYLHVMTPFGPDSDPEVKEREWQNVLAANRQIAATGVFDYETGENKKLPWWQARI